jgi:hypothetical protein
MEKNISPLALRLRRKILDACCRIYGEDKRDELLAIYQELQEDRPAVTVPLIEIGTDNTSKHSTH